MNNTELQKQTAIQKEQQFKSMDEIVDDILKVLFSNEDITVNYGKSNNARGNRQALLHTYCI